MRIANCSKSKIDEKLFPAIYRYGYQKGMPALIKKYVVKDNKSINVFGQLLIFIFTLLFWINYVLAMT